MAKNNSFEAGFASAVGGAVAGFLVKVLLLSNDYGTDFDWLFWLIGFTIIIGSWLQTNNELKNNGTLFGIGYLAGLLVSTIAGL